MFKDRIDAGRRLAKMLSASKDKTNVIVLAIPRGGVVTGYTIAKELHLPLDVILAKKIGHPSNPEYAIGSVSLKGYKIEGNLDLPKKYVRKQVKAIQDKLRTRYESYYKHNTPLILHNKTVIIVDDGVATGNTMKASIEIVSLEHPKEIIVAVPVGPSNMLTELGPLVDRFYCIETPDPFISVGKHYENFTQVTDSEVLELLERNKSELY